MKIKTAITSYGMSGMVFHGPLLKVNPNFEVSTILERTKENSRKHFPEAKIVKDYNDILKSNVDLVVVNLPDHLHFSYAKQALEAGKHVVVEKPFVQKQSEGEELINQAAKKGLVLSVFQNRRWDGDFLTVQKIIREKMLGRLVEYEAHFDRFRNYIQDSWKEQDEYGTGTLFNLGPHLIDQALVLFGKPEAVYADIRKTRTNSKVDDNFDIKLYYSNVKVTLKAGYLYREQVPRYQLHGTDGSFLKHGLDPQEEMLKMGILPDSPGWGSEPEEKWGILNTEINGIQVKGKIETIVGNYNAYYSNIYEAISNKKPLMVKPEEANNVIRIIELALKSTHTRTAEMF